MVLGTLGLVPSLMYEGIPLSRIRWCRPRLYDHYVTDLHRINSIIDFYWEHDKSASSLVVAKPLLG